MHYKQNYVLSLGMCSVKNCNKPAFNKKGLCSAHYAKARKYGDPTYGIRTPNGDPARFVDEALSYTGDDCILWPFASAKSGYGRIYDAKKRKGVVVSAYACEKAHGHRPFPKSEASHSCGNGNLGCITPSHLSWKTRAGNMADTVLHGTSLRGTRQPNSKLTEDNVKLIMQMKGLLLQKDIAAMFGVHKETIGAIHRGRIWGWLFSD